MSMTDEIEPVLSPPSAAEAIDDLKANGGLDALFAKIDAGELQLTGVGGFVPSLIKAALERGLQAELTEHLGYEKGDPEARFFENSRNGTTPKTMAERSAFSGVFRSCDNCCLLACSTHSR